MDKRFWAIIGVIAAIFFGFLLFNGEDKNDSASASKVTNHVMGNPDAGIMLVEYGDFQCPFCAQYYPIVKGVTEKYGDKIAFQFRNLPLTQPHPNAFAAARAAEAADKQGKFWEMYDMLYQNQQAWAPSQNVRTVFDGYAKQLDLDVTKFKKDFASKAVNDAINADVAAFRKTGEPVSTPTFFLNGKAVQATSVEEFSKLIDAEIAKKAETPAGQ